MFACWVQQGWDGFDPVGPKFGLKLIWVGFIPKENITSRCELARSLKIERTRRTPFVPVYSSSPLLVHERGCEGRSRAAAGEARMAQASGHGTGTGGADERAATGQGTVAGEGAVGLCRDGGSEPATVG